VRSALALVDSGTIRVIDVLILTKDEDGSLEATELADESSRCRLTWTSVRRGREADAFWDSRDRDPRWWMPIARTRQLDYEQSSIDDRARLVTVARTVLREQIKEILLERILRGELEPGERLVESEPFRGAPTATSVLSSGS
jgi:hypothetical protein